MHHKSGVVKVDGLESCKKKNTFPPLFNSIGLPRITIGNGLVVVMYVLNPSRSDLASPGIRAVHRRVTSIRRGRVLADDMLPYLEPSRPHAGLHRALDAPAGS
jgi:hypothetical protein